MAKDTLPISATINAKTVEYFKAAAKKRDLPFSRYLDNMLTKLANQKFDELDRILVSFGEYILSDERTQRVKENSPEHLLQQKLQSVSMDDLRVWSEKV